MSGAKHTPGPWGVSSTSMSTIKAFDFMGESNVIVATAQGNDNSGFFPSYDERDANARLIAAAPDLLWITSRLATLAEGLGNGNSGAEAAAWRLAEEAHAVIAKVQGEAS